MNFTEAARGACPYCAGEVFLGETDGHPTALHTMPACTSYETMPLVEFVIAVRKKAEAS